MVDLFQVESQGISSLNTSNKWANSKSPKKLPMGLHNINGVRSNYLRKISELGVENFQIRTLCTVYMQEWKTWPLWFSCHVVEMLNIWHNAFAFSHGPIIFIPCNYVNSRPFWTKQIRSQISKFSLQRG